MSDETAPIPYKVIYSVRVREGLIDLVKRATPFGRGRILLDAIREVDRRLRIYPQFGQPLRDLSIKPLQLWIATIGHLVIHYVLDEDRRQVFVIRPFKPLPRAGS